MTLLPASSHRAVSDSRATTMHRLRTERFDVLVVGGGIIGAGIAALAAELGLNVALVDRRDFASGASSASSKLIHGGLRYLRMGDFRLIREALHESETLVASVAPHLVHRLRFLLPVYEGAPYGRGAVRTALWLYRTLSGSEAANTLLPSDIAAALVPSLRLEGLHGAGVYSDAQTNDARLCIANLRAAADNGAAIVNYTEVVSIDSGRRGQAARVEVIDRVAGEHLDVDARTVVNAAGPWIDHVRRLDDSSAGTSVLLSKGAHLVLVAPPGWHAAVTIPIDRSRVSFAIPWEGALLLGTTDEAFDGDPDNLDVTEADERQILDEAGRALESEILRHDRILGRFAGLRVLPVATGRTAAARRETMIVRGRGGMITVAGGKLTTYRRIAASALDALRPELGLRTIDTTPTPLPGAVNPKFQTATILCDHPELDPNIANVLSRTYGSLAGEVLSLAKLDPALMNVVAPGANVVAAQILHARDHEWAETAEDVLRRRTTLSLRGFNSDEIYRRVEALLLRDVATHPLEP